MVLLINDNTDVFFTVLEAAFHSVRGSKLSLPQVVIVVFFVLVNDV